MKISQKIPSLARFLLVVIAAIGQFSVQSQTPIFQSFNLGTGKKTVRVQSMAQDAMHRIYYGTNEGLMRYDGNEYLALSFCDSLDKHSVTALHYHEGTLWAGTSDGNLFQFTGEDCQKFGGDSALTSARISDILTNGSQIYIATYGDGVYMKDSESLLHINTETGLGDDYTYDLELHLGRVWVGTDAGITVIRNDGTIGGVVSMKNGLPDNIVQTIATVDSSWIALGSHDLGVSLFNPTTGVFKLIEESESSWEHGAIEALEVDEHGDVWAGTKSSGLICIHFEGTQRSIRAFSEINGLGSNRIHSLLRDAENNLWVGNAKGVTLYRGSTFEYLTVSDGLPGSNLYDVLVAADGSYWLASDKGLTRFSYSASGEGLVETFLQDAEGGQNIQVVSLFQDDAGIIWMGTYGFGLFYLTPGSDEIKNVGADDGLENTNVLDINQDANGRLWLATLGGGVASLTWQDNQPMVQHLERDEALSSNYIYTVFLDHSNQLWIGTDGAGVAIYDCNDNYFKPGLEGELAKSTVYSITEDQDGALWFATAEEGLFRYIEGALTTWGEAQGVRSNQVVALKTGSAGEVYAVHSFGVDVLVKGGEQFRGYSGNKEDFNFEPNLNAVFAGQDELWIGTESGAVKLQCDHGFQDKDVPRLTLTSLRVRYEDHPFEEDKAFDYDQNHFIFDYLGIWMKHPDQVTYKYILEGFDKQWSFETKSTVATYSSLPPGTYTFRVQGTNGNGAWSDAEASSYSFVILKPFWMEWWFYVGLFVLLVTVVVGFIRRRTQILIREKQHLEEEVQKRTLEISNQKDIIEAKSDEILASISYARRIQEAILPPLKMVKEQLPNSFVLYKPKDIVAGDFYWLDTSGDLVLFAAADCTGHGVPGAMVSVVCSNALNRAVREFDLSTPAAILDKVRELVIERFSKSEEDVKDGMDIALCALDKKTNTLHYSGAHNPLWIVSKRPIEEFGPSVEERKTTFEDLHLYEIKPDKQPIGKYAETKPYTNHVVSLKEGDTIYVFSDGYADQFGGERMKKFKYRPMKNLVLSMQAASMEAQHDKLDDHFEAWRGDLEQVDDVCIIGVRL